MATATREDDAEPEPSTPAPAVAREPRRSTLALVRDALLSLTHIVEDSTELVGATLRQELAQFRVELARHAIAVAAVVVGAALLTAGLAMLASQLTGSWPLTLVVFGALYLGTGLAFQRAIGRDRESGPK